MAHRLSAPAALYVLAFAWHLAWAWPQSAPWDWDPSYYVGVARNIVAGRGAVTDAVWNLGWLPPSLTHPSDLHWMPVPSRWLVPFLLLPVDPWRAAQIGGAVAAATWAPLGWAWGRLLGTNAVLAGAVAGLGGAYVKYAASPDSIGLYGLTGGLALYFTARGLTAPAAGWSAVAALTRGDGFLLSLACATGPVRRWILLAGPLAAGLWAARGALVAGPDALARIRWRMTNSVDPVQWLVSDEPSRLGLADRVAFLAGHVNELGRAAILVTGFVLAPLLFRRDARLLPALVYGLAYPVIDVLTAPAVAVEGSVFRSGAALWPLVAAVSVATAGRWWRLGPVAVLIVVTGFTVASARGPTFREPFDDCAELAGVPAGAPILSYDPLGTATRCGHPGLILGRATRPADLALLADQYGIRHALCAPDGYDSWTVRASEFPLEGWSRSGRVWSR